MFYGANGHWDYKQTPDEQIAALRMMGMEPGYYRMATDGGHTLGAVVNVAKALRSTSIQMICCCDIKMVDGNGQLYANESEAYYAGYKTGIKVATALVPHGVNIFETGNELDAANGIRIPVQDVQGGVPEDFENANFPSLRGVINGCYDAVRAVGGSTVRIASNGFTACSFACSDMLADGTQPDGSSGHRPVLWDITNWHNYRCYGSMLDMSMDYMKPTCNLLDHLKAKYKRPIFVGEWNANESDDDATRASWATQFLGELYGAGRDMFGVEAAIVYHLICGDPWGVVNYDQTIQSTFGETVRDFIAAHPA
jgi:hypothetical protein